MKLTRQNVMKYAHTEARNRMFPGKVSYKESFIFNLKQGYILIKRQEREEWLLSLPEEQHIAEVIKESCTPPSRSMLAYMVHGIKSKRRGQRSMPVDIFFNH